ncbi:MAG: hypothetical protein OEM94_00665 [Acidimicrobiia bacterium]|nr:hypothetical protein [Acidimicrobiia bacterium]
MRHLAPILALMLIAAACTDAPPNAVSTAPPINTAAATTVPTTTAGISPVAVTSTMPIVDAVITVREISDDEVIYMVPDAEALGEEYEGFEVAELSFETNEEVVRHSVLDSQDEEEDIIEFGRSAGARSSLMPRQVRIGPSDVTGIQLWVAIFTADQGASDYLEDFVQDASKGVGGGHPSDLAIATVDGFVVNEVGQEATGLILAEGHPGLEPQLYETLVAFRVGRILGFASVLAPDDSDRRVRAVTLAETLEARVVGVASGEITPPPPPTELLEAGAYSFTYYQVIDKGSSRASIRTSGIEVGPDKLQCLLEVEIDDLKTQREYVADGDVVWLDDADAEEPGFQRVPLEGFGVQGDLIYCPGWPVSITDSGLDAVIALFEPEQIELDETPALRYELGTEAAQAIGLINEGSRVRVDSFDLVVDAEQPWMRQLSIRMSGSSSAFAATFGDGFTRLGGRNVTVTIDATADRFNDPDLIVVTP